MSDESNEAPTIAEMRRTIVDLRSECTRSVVRESGLTADLIGEREVIARLTAERDRATERADVAVLAWRVTHEEVAALRAEVIHLEARRGALLAEVDRLRSDHALTLHAIAEWLLPGAVPADLSADTVVAAAEETHRALAAQRVTT